MTNCQRKDANAVQSEASLSARVSVYRVVKRLFDILVSSVLLLLLAVPMLLIAVAVKLDSPGKALFRQKRIGLGLKEFEILKFRTMHSSAPSAAAKRELDDPYRYITRVGRVLRRTSLDELPQLINILRGDMSLIGPRPLIINEKDIHELRELAGVYAIRPGITGWAQINGRDNVSAAEKAAYDSYYLRNLSFALDARIFLHTVLVVFKCDGYCEGKG